RNSWHRGATTGNKVTNGAPINATTISATRVVGKSWAWVGVVPLIPHLLTLGTVPVDGAQNAFVFLSAFGNGLASLVACFFDRLLFGIKSRNDGDTVHEACPVAFGAGR